MNDLAVMTIVHDVDRKEPYTAYCSACASMLMWNLLTRDYAVLFIGEHIYVEHGRDDPHFGRCGVAGSIGYIIEDIEREEWAKRPPMDPSPTVTAKRNAEVLAGKRRVSFMSPNLRAILYAMTHTHKLENCSSGFALWKRDIEWSQGHTPSNAVRDKDLLELCWRGYLIPGHSTGHLVIAPHRMAECHALPYERFVPTSENAYTGEALIP